MFFVRSCQFLAVENDRLDVGSIDQCLYFCHAAVCAIFDVFVRRPDDLARLYHVPYGDMMREQKRLFLAIAYRQRLLKALADQLPKAIGRVGVITFLSSAFLGKKRPEYQHLGGGVVYRRQSFLSRHDGSP